MINLHVRSATSNDFDVIKRLLQEAELPVEDLNPQNFPLFHLAESDNSCVGAIGMERHGDIGLLRSLVVAQNARGQGLGAVLVDTLEREAAALGVRELWLLTIDADAFFKQRQYGIVSRECVPERIRQTEEFSGLCPDTAHLMMKTIA